MVDFGVDRPEFWWNFSINSYNTDYYKLKFYTVN